MLVDWRTPVQGGANLLLIFSASWASGAFVLLLGDRGYTRGRNGI